MPVASLCVLAVGSARLAAALDEELPAAGGSTRVITASPPGSLIGRDVRVLCVRDGRWLVLTEPADRDFVTSALASAGADPADVTASFELVRVPAADVPVTAGLPVGSCLSLPADAAGLPGGTVAVVEGAELLLLVPIGAAGNQAKANPSPR